MGLGLALVRSLVERHGGTLKIESALGEGTTVFVEFPDMAASNAA
jgi:signal transduction histidine kinase